MDPIRQSSSHTRGRPSLVTYCLSGMSSKGFLTLRGGLPRPLGAGAICLLTVESSISKYSNRSSRSSMYINLSGISKDGLKGGLKAFLSTSF